MKCLYALLFLSTLAILGCTLEKEPVIPTGATNLEDPIFEMAEVNPVQDLGAHFFQVTARLKTHGQLNIGNHGWVWGETPDATLLDTNQYKSISLGILNGDSFSALITDLELGKPYYLRPFVSTGDTTFYGPEQCSFLGVHFTINTDTEIFQGAEVQFTNTLVNGTNYLWDFGDGDTHNGPSPMHTFDKGTGVLTVQLTATKDGCSIAKDIILKVLPNPFADYWAPIPGGEFFMGDSAIMDYKPATDPYFARPVHKAFVLALDRKTGRKHHLPTEAEWEYAARGGQPDSIKFAGSNALADVGWYWFNTTFPHQPQPVKGLAKNGYGLYDMSGNVREWVEDDFNVNYNNAPSDGSAYTKTPRDNERMSRGGDIAQQFPERCYVTYRFHSSPFDFAGNVGFRLAR